MFTLSADATRVSAPSLGRLLARGAGVIGNLLTLPFDLYSAIRNFCQLNRLQGLARQDAIVAGSLASIGAGAGLALAGASALGASLSVVGPLGLGLGALMIASTQLYAAVRQVQEVKQWITLSSGEEAMLGLRSFVAPGTLDRATAQRVQQARHETLLQQNAQRILSAPGEHAAGVVLCPRPRVHSRLIAATCDEDHQHEHLALGDTATPLHARTSPLSYFDTARICPLSYFKYRQNLPAARRLRTPALRPLWLRGLCAILRRSGRLRSRSWRRHHHRQPTRSERHNGTLARGKRT